MASYDQHFNLSTLVDAVERTFEAAAGAEADGEHYKDVFLELAHVLEDLLEDTSARQCRELAGDIGSLCNQASDLAEKAEVVSVVADRLDVKDLLLPEILKSSSEDLIFIPWDLSREQAEKALNAAVERLHRNQE